MKTLVTALFFIITLPSVAYSQNISGSYVASTTYGNIFCMTLTQQNDKIEGSFDEVDFKQIVSIEDGVYKDKQLRFNVSFKVNQNTLLLSMQAEKLKTSPNLFFGHYNIGSEKGDFILYEVKSKPRVCKNLYQK